MIRITISDLHHINDKSVLDEPSYEEMNNIVGGRRRRHHHQRPLNYEAIGSHLRAVRSELNFQIGKTHELFKEIM